MADRWGTHERHMIRLLIDTFDAKFITPRIEPNCSIDGCKRAAWIDDEWNINYCQQHWRTRNRTK